MIVAPADGKIIDILKLGDGEEIRIDKGLFGRIKSLTGDMGKGPYLLVSIFMSPMVVHVQRTPISGKVTKIQHQNGSFRVTNTLRAIDNERSEIMIDSAVGRVKVIQIAGWLVRRIETWLEEGSDASTGQRLGRIIFGSQVSMLIPHRDSIELNVSKGQRVKAGETVMATFQEGKF